MRTKLTLILSLFLGFFVVDKTTAQVNGVNYLMKYDTATCLYDCYFIVNNGSTSGPPNANSIAFFSQFSIVSLAGDSLEIARSYTPIESDGDTAQWNFSSKIKAPAAQPQNDFWSVIPNMTTAYYDALSPGDTVKIFSVRKVGTTTLCAADLRIFENGTDPTSSDPGMEGSDFSCAFTIGGAANEVYEGNAEQILGPNPIIWSTNLTCSGGIEIDLTASTSSCQGPLTYAWTGPNSYSSTTQDVNRSGDPLNNGQYKVVIRDAIGCRDSTTVDAVSKPNAGPDVTACAGTTHTITGTPLTGTWSKISGNTQGTTTNISPGVNQVVFTNTASGTYRFRYSIGATGTCTDTVNFNIDPLPSYTIADNTLCIGQTFNNNLTGIPSGGTWVSLSPTIVTVAPGVPLNANANTTAVAQGTATFRYTRTLTGCSIVTTPITVNPNPNIVGSVPICIGGSLGLQPNIAGTWTSATPAVATIVTGTGVVTGVSAGSTLITYTEASTGCLDTQTQIVIAKPTTNISGNDSICVGSTTSFTASTTGTWISTNPLVATINNAGLVTGVAPGNARFVFTAVGGCSSDTTGIVRVESDPVAGINDPRICDGTTAILSPAVGGTWVSSNNTIATVTGNIVTAQNNGTVTFTFTNILGCSDGISLTVDPLPTVTTNMDTICITGVAQLTPTTGGTWNLLPGGFVTYNVVTKTVTGISEGTARLTFTETVTGCLSDTLDVEVQPRPDITTDNGDMCVGEIRNFTPNSGGIWESLNGGVATITNSGTVTAIASGTVEFRFISSTTNCASDWSGPIDVNPRPVVTVPGDAVLCIGETLILSVSGSPGGFWTSSHPLLAEIDPFTGEVTALAAGTNIRFTYVDGNNCSSAASTPIEVKLKPNVNFLGPNPICINGITTVTANGAIGTWASGNTGVALINNAGTVTGVATGTTTLTFTQTDGLCVSDPLNVTVSPKPVVVFPGDTLCLGGTITLTATPPGAGSWSSNNPTIASISSGGLVTALAQGNTTFIFTSNNGNCPSDNSNALIVNAPVTLTMPNSNLCIGDTMVLIPSSGGTWTSSNPLIASVSGATVTADSAGLVSFTYLDVNGCQSTTNGQLTVNPEPATSMNFDERCVGLTSQASPSTGGTWVSSDESIATINNSGLITAVSPGTAYFTFTSSTTSCSSDGLDSFTVNPGPTIDYVGDSVLCIGETATIAPNPVIAGTWAIAPSFSTTVASITTGGDIVALTAGFTRFVFTSTATGCKSEPSGPLTVNPRPTVFISGLGTICIGATSQLSPSSGGTWSSNNPLIATVNNSGLVSGVAQGGTTFVFTDNTTTCISAPTDSLFVSPAPTVGIVGDTDICVGGKTELTPNTGGTWSSTNNAIATVNNNGIVTSIAPGVVTFSFSDNIGCGSTGTTAPITIANCTNPDINATFINIVVPGDVNTNDAVTLSSTYGPSFTLVSKPLGSSPTLTLSTSGSYSFVSASPGVYKYLVPVCVPPVAIGCPVEDLWITVVDNLDSTKMPVVNVDFATTFIGDTVILPTLKNDSCVVVTGCSLDASSVTIIDLPAKGNALVLPNGDIRYAPAALSSGFDTLVYRVCVDGQPTNCAEARQIITITSNTAANITVADDDFATTAEGLAISGNVSLNDSDPEGDNTHVVPVSYSGAYGDITIGADGAYTFTPAEYFTGPISFEYTSYDDNSVSVDSQHATLYILVVPDFAIKVRVYLEGSLIFNGGATAPDGRPLMRDNLRSCPNPAELGTRFIPNADPYKYQPADYAMIGVDILPRFNHVVPGGIANAGRFDSIPTNKQSIIFANPLPGEEQSSLVDWVFVELRSKTSNTTVLSTRSGLVQRDGDVVDFDGFSPLKFPGLSIDDYYVVVRHRSHLGAMTANPQTPKQLANLVNFTVDSLDVFNYGTTPFVKTYYNALPPTQNVSGVDFTGLSMNEEVEGIFGYRALWGGDFDGNGKIKFDNPNDDLNLLFNDVFNYPTNNSLNANYDFAFGYLPGDFDMNGKSKYDNPDDDKNLLYGKVLFYPLNEDLGFLSNYDFFIEQLP